MQLITLCALIVQLWHWQELLIVIMAFLFVACMLPILATMVEEQRRMREYEEANMIGEANIVEVA